LIFGLTTAVSHLYGFANFGCLQDWRESVIKRSLACLSVLTALTLVWSVPALAQSGTSSISGTVVDAAGGAIPGAAVTAKNESGASFETVTNSEGVFNIPAVAPGPYKVTVSLTGFKTAVVPSSTCACCRARRPR
jgi:hypothetical protein